MSDYPGPPPALKENSLLASLRQATIGDYEVLAELGSGGMAVVYLAHDLALDRKVAIKVMLPSLEMAEGAAERFKREARTAASISHPNIIPIYAVKEHEDLLYFVMQFVPGRSLSSVIEEVAPMPIPMMETILFQVGEALDFGHRHGVIHRDVKPGNILLDEEGRAVVTDFGIAKVATDQSITRTGGVVGTPLYMSPEQCSGDTITGSSDQYSLGLVAYEMLTGHPPFADESPIRLMYLRVMESPPSVQQLRPDCPARLADSVMRMLERNPEHRWPTCVEAVEAIGRPAGETNDTVRRQIADLAKTGHSQRILAEMRTPTSPVPPARAPGAQATALSHPGTARAPHASTQHRFASMRWAGGIAAVVLAVWGTVQLMPRQNGDGAGAGSQPSEATRLPVAAGIQFEVVPEAADLLMGDSIVLRTSGAGPVGDSTKTTVRWESSDPSVATVSAAGLVNGLAEGIVRVTASSLGHSATAIVRVRREPAAATQEVRQRTLVSVIVSPTDGILTPGATLRLQASLRDTDGRPLDGGPVTWRSEDELVATVSAAGVVTGSGLGTTRISATRNRVTGWATIVVRPVPVASIALRPTAVFLTVGESVSLEAMVRDETGAIVGDVDVSWTSDNPAVVSVSPDGIATGVESGTTAITARLGDRSTSVAVTVTRPAAATDTEKPPTAGEIHEEVVAVLVAFGRAVESGDLSRLRQAYPGMSNAEARAYGDLLPKVEQLTFTVDDSLEHQGGDLIATGRAHYRYSTPRTPERTFEFRARLTRTADALQLASIGFQEP